MPARRSNSCLCWPVLVSVALILAASGCSRQHYRLQADREVYRLVDNVGNDAHLPVDGYTIDIDPASRMFDPFSPDFPPMPPDDPASHRYMHCVDCMHGYPCWHQNGDVPFVANPAWQSYLPYNEQGQLVVDRDLAVRVALVNSPDFQQELEELYLSALDVSFERFTFDTQFFGGNSTFFTADGRTRAGGDSSSILNTDTNLLARKMFAAGGELVVGFANSFVWQFAGTNTESVNTLLNFSLVQPLLRGGGRAKVLETLTISERALLANVRQMERFRRGFYLDVVIGRGGTPGPQRRGGFFGGSGLTGFTGVGGGGFGRVGGAGVGFNLGGGQASGAGAAQAQGYLGLLQDQRNILTLESNVAGLRNSLAQIEAVYEAGRIDRLQVDQARQALYDAQSRLLTAKVAYVSSTDQLKLTLGMPPTIDVVIRDPLLDPFALIEPRIVALQNSTADLLAELRNPDLPTGVQSVEGLLERANELRLSAWEHLGLAKDDFQALLDEADTRRAALEELTRELEDGQYDVNPDLFSAEAFDERVRLLGNDLDAFDKEFEELSTDLIRLIDTPPAADAEDTVGELLSLVVRLSRELSELSLLQARARLDRLSLQKVEITQEKAFAIARQYRRDWKNARAALVNQWRLIQFNANDLRSVADVTFAGDLGNTADKPFRLRDTQGRLQAGLDFDAPLTRLVERNNYRQALIEYQQARRQYYQIVDQIKSGLRVTLRTIDLNKMNFEIRRAAVVIAVSQVEQARYRLEEPPRPGEVSELGSTTVRDLVGALDNLLTAQNDFLSVWVNYQVQRLNLDFDLGTMELDHDGLWIDPGTIDSSTVGEGDADGSWEADVTVEEDPTWEDDEPIEPVPHDDDW